MLAWVIVLIGLWTWNRWEAKRGPLPHDISRTTRVDVCVLGVNALFPDNVTHIQNARRNTLGASPLAKGGRFSLQLFRWAVRRCPVMLEKVVLL